MCTDRVCGQQHRPVVARAPEQPFGPVDEALGHLGRGQHLPVAQQPGRPHARLRSTVAAVAPRRPTLLGSPMLPLLMSKRTVKRKLRAKKKANHGKKPNCGRG